jgi:hypothetical protein
MTRWGRGEAQIEQMIENGELQRVTGAGADGADGAPWLAKATVTIATAESVTASDPNSAYTLAYDSARFACVSLLAQQGLRPTTTGGHYAVQVAVTRQSEPPLIPTRSCADAATNLSTQGSQTRSWSKTRRPKPSPAREPSSTPQPKC